MGRTLIIFLFFLVSKVSWGQESIIKFVSDYFRVNPFEAKFSTFIKALSYDKQLLMKNEHIDDYSNYAISGVYKVFNPFGLNASNMQMHIRSIGMRNYFDVPTPMYMYELIAHFPDSPKGRKKIRKDYWQMVNRFRRLYNTDFFTGTEPGPLQRKSLNENGDNKKFFFSGYKNQASCYLKWQVLPESGEIEVSISVCLAVIDNRAYPLGHYPGRKIDEQYDLLTWKQNVK